MPHSELLHRFFDDGLTEPLEDSLFGRIAVDPELRRQFVEHLKLHSMIQEDVASITTPSHVSQQLFVNLGLTPPEVVPAHAGTVWKKRTAAALTAASALLVEYRSYIATAVAAAGITALLFMYTSRDVASTSVTTPIGSERTTPTEESRATPERSDVSEADAPATGTASAEHRDATSDAGVRHGGGGVRVRASGERAGNSVSNSDSRASLISTPSRNFSTHGVENDALPIPMAMLHINDDDNAEIPHEQDIATIPYAPQSGIVKPWHFFSPIPGTSVLSNLVVELRQQYGRSYPEVDLPHNSHKVFENMALNIVYKATDHHAFGFEYGREDFGQVYDRTMLVQQYRVPDPNLVQVGSIPPPSTVSEYRENRMLDVFGAVWKLSLPEYGILGSVYPYMRTFVGATKQGPLGKVRIGLEMYPSNFSMFNVGIEGGMLRYSVEQSAYYSAKLNYSFGVAVGF